MHKKQMIEEPQGILPQGSGKSHVRVNPTGLLVRRRVMTLSSPGYTKLISRGPRNKQESGWDTCWEFTVMGSGRRCNQQSLQRGGPSLCQTRVMARRWQWEWGRCLTVRGLLDPDQADTVYQSSNANSLGS